MRAQEHFSTPSNSSRQSIRRLLQTYSDLISNPPRTVSPGRLEALRLHAAAQVCQASLTRRGKPGYNHFAIGRDLAEMAKSAPIGLKSSIDRRTADKLLMDTYHDLVQKRPKLRSRLIRKPAPRLDSIDQAYQDRDDARAAHSRIILNGTSRIAEARTQLRQCTDARDQLLAFEVHSMDLQRACDAVDAAAALFITRMREQNELISAAGRAVDEAEARLQAARDAHLVAIRAEGKQ